MSLHRRVNLACRRPHNGNRARLPMVAAGRTWRRLQDWSIAHVNQDAVCPVAALTPTRMTFTPRAGAGPAPPASVVPVPASWQPTAALMSGSAAAEPSALQPRTDLGVKEVLCDAALSLSVDCTLDSIGLMQADAAAQATAQGLAAVTAGTPFWGIAPCTRGERHIHPACSWTGFG
jgi:hypothetical protein